MSDLRLAITIVGIVVGISAAMVIGDYLGYKIGRMRLATFALVAVLFVVVAFAIFSGVYLGTHRG